MKSFDNSIINNTLANINKSVYDFIENLKKEDLADIFENRRIYYNTFKKQLSTKNIIGETFLLESFTAPYIFIPKDIHKSQLTGVYDDSSNLYQIFDKDQLTQMIQDNIKNFELFLIDVLTKGDNDSITKRRLQSILKGAHSSFWKSKGYPNREFVEKFGGIQKTTELVFSTTMSSSNKLYKNINSQFVFDYLSFLKDNYSDLGDYHIFRQVLFSYQKVFTIYKLNREVDTNLFDYFIYSETFKQPPLSTVEILKKSNIFFAYIYQKLLTENVYKDYIKNLTEKFINNKEIEFDYIDFFVLKLLIDSDSREDKSSGLIELFKQLFLTKSFLKGKNQENIFIEKINIFKLLTIRDIRVQINFSQIIENGLNTGKDGLIYFREDISSKKINTWIEMAPIHSIFGYYFLDHIEKYCDKIFVIDTTESKEQVDKYKILLNNAEVIQIYSYIDSEKLKENGTSIIDLKINFIKERLDFLEKMVDYK